MDTRTCYELRIGAGATDKPFFEGALTHLGETDFVTGAVDCDLPLDFDLNGDADAIYEELSKDSAILLYSEDKEHLDELRVRLIEAAREEGVPLDSGSIKVQPIPNQQWRESWRDSFKPLVISGTFAILPPWEDPAAFHVPHKIVIDPGMAFGTGQHATTQVCLELFAGLDVPAKVFDAGTGSGILAIAACKAGSDLALGCDIDPDSVRIARENALLNHVQNAMFTELAVADIEERDFDLVFANIQDRPLRLLLPALLRMCAEEGHLILSGLLASEAEAFRDFGAAHGLEVRSMRTLGDWVGLLCRKQTLNPAT